MIKMKEKNLIYSKDFSGKESDFFLRCGFDAISDYLLSITYRRLSNRSSGVRRTPEHPEGFRVIGEVELADPFKGDNKENARIYHEGIDWHIKHLKIDGKDFFIVSNGNLGNNFWNLAWGRDQDSHIYCLKGEPFLERAYSCFLVPQSGKPRIQKVRFNGLEQVLDENGRNISEEVNWCNYGQQILREGNVVPIEEIIEEFYDVRHVLDLRDYAKKGDPDGEKRMQEDMEVIRSLYLEYPEKFREKMIAGLKAGRKRGEHYHNVLGIVEKGIVVYQSKGVVEDIAKRLADKGTKDAIILDNGGSVGTYASWENDNKGGWLNKCSYFRPERISYIAFVLKDDGK